MSLRLGRDPGPGAHATRDPYYCPCCTFPMQHDRTVVCGEKYVCRKCGHSAWDVDEVWEQVQRRNNRDHVVPDGTHRLK